VKDFIGRDVKPGTIASMVTQLEAWCDNCGDTMRSMETEITRANKMKEDRIEHRKRMEEEVSTLSDTMKNEYTYEMRHVIDM